MAVIPSAARDLGGGRPGRSVDRLVGGLCRIVLGAFFREIEVVGEDRVPREGPLVVVANHTNGLVDPLMILGPLRVPARFLAKSTLWRIPVLSRLIDLAGAIPVYRRQDVEKEAARELTQANEETFARCHEVLAGGGAIALFPEGTSHSLPGLRPLKTGAARIALEAERKFGPLGVQILPVGLIFEAKGRFRSRALVQVGDPFTAVPGEESEGQPLALAAQGEPAGSLVETPTARVGRAGSKPEPDDSPEAVRALTARIDQALTQVTLDYPSWEEARLLARAADLYGRPSLDLPRGRSLEETVSLRQAFLREYPEVRERSPVRTAEVAAVVGEYDRMLRALGLRDEQVAAAYPLPPVARFVGRTLLRLLVLLPVALIGSALNLLPYLLVRLIARFARDAPDQQATLKVFPGLAIYPLCWVAQAVAVGHYARPAWGALALLLAPFAGQAALRFHEHRYRFGREARAYLLLRARRGLAEELRRRRQAAYRGVEALVEEYLQPDDRPAPS